MVIYTNRTRFPAIVTLSIESVDKPDKALKVGDGSVFVDMPAAQGFCDIYVDAGKTIILVDGTIGTIFALRNAP